MCLKALKALCLKSRIDCPAAWEEVVYSYDKAVRASFFVTWKIAREKAPHIAGKNLIKPAAVKMARILCGDVVANTLTTIPLSNDTIKRRIQELSEDVLQQTIASVKRSGNFNLQLDETTDIGNDVLLIVFVRYLDTN